MNLMNEYDTVHYNIVAVTKLVESLNAEEEEGWVYKLKFSPNNTSAIIEVYDEVGYLGTL